MKSCQVGLCRLILGDCRDWDWSELGPDDSIVTDPPYGIGYDPGRHVLGDGRPNSYQRIENDGGEFDLSFLFSLPCFKIFWGAENYYRQIPFRGRWICWHKRSPSTRANSMPSSDFELAWMSATTGRYLYFRVIHGGAINADSVKGNNQPRLHPTQKPVALMERCIEICPKQGKIIDPFMGSGTTAVAAMRKGRPFIGIEIVEEYYEIAVDRCRSELKRPRGFDV